MANVFRLLPASLTVLLGLLLSGYAVGLGEVKVEDDDDGLYREEPSSSTTPEPTYPDGVNTIPGDALIHYPVYEKIFKTSFSCSGRLAGFYADIDARCQIWHICDVDGRMQSFLCTNGTIFSQQTRVCEWWYNTNCEANYVRRNYEHNKELYQTFKEPEQIPAKHGDRHREEPGKNNVPVGAQSAGRNTETNRQGKVQFFPTQKSPTIHIVSGGQGAQRPPPYRDFSKDQFGPRGQNSQPPHGGPQNSQVQQEDRSRQSRLEYERGLIQRQEVEQRRPQQGETPQAEQQQPTREQLEQRRQAARDEFYSIPAKIEQERRITQRRFQEQQRTEEQRRTSAPQPTSPPPKRDDFKTFTEPRRSDPDSAPPTFPNSSNNQSPSTTPQHKFRHSTPRKHNVSFRPSPQLDEKDERQIPEETQQNGFPFYKRRFYSRQGWEFEGPEVGLTAPQPSSPPGTYINPYLPTSNEPIAVTPTAPEIQPPSETSPTTSTTPAPKRRTRKRRLRPIKKQNPENVNKIPLPVLSYRPPPPENPTLPPISSLLHQLPRAHDLNRIESLEPSKTFKKPKNASAARVVVKRKFRDGIGNIKPVRKENRDQFSGNPHLEQKGNKGVGQAHAAQKRCAVVGSGNTFKVFC